MPLPTHSYQWMKLPVVFTQFIQGPVTKILASVFVKFKTDQEVINGLSAPSMY